MPLPPVVVGQASACNLGARPLTQKPGFAGLFLFGVQRAEYARAAGSRGSDGIGRAALREAPGQPCKGGSLDL